MYQSIPSLTMPPGRPPGTDFFERANSPSPEHKESVKIRPLGQKNRAKAPPQGNCFQNSAKKRNMGQKL